MNVGEELRGVAGCSESKFRSDFDHPNIDIVRGIVDHSTNRR